MLRLSFLHSRDDRFSAGLLQLIVLMILLPAFSVTSALSSQRIVVFAAASLQNALSESVKKFEQSSGHKVVLSFAASSIIARQIVAGAPADLVITADEKWMDWLEQKSAIQPQTRKNLTGNRLVLVVRAETENWADPEKLMTGSRFAMADPQTVPAGRYARQALKARKIWATAKTNAIYAENVRVALAMVARGDVAAAIVYNSDAEVEPRVRSLVGFLATDHDPIRYPMALTQKAGSAALSLQDYLAGAEVADIFKKLGFSNPVK